MIYDPDEARDDARRDDPELSRGVGFGEWDADRIAKVTGVPVAAIEKAMIDPDVRLRDDLPTRWPRMARNDAERYDDDLSRDL